MSAKVTGLGHIGIFVQDLDAMTEFYRDFIGMTVTKKSASGSFLSADPAAVDHEIALVKGRPSAEDPHLIQQISMRVETLADLKDFYERVRKAGYKLDRVVSHASAIGCYFRDPEGNPTEVFWLTGYESWGIVSIPIDLDLPDDEILAQVRGNWEQVRHLKMGEQPDEALAATMFRK
ncbi:MAG: hypothetical protein EPO13_11930 [Actinomycetota bacterium]|nr:MAG: hypothetical protein EPO13_11930 [Actinomycetota bacterium]